MPPQTSQVGFLSLPSKARLRIYEYALVSEPQVIPHLRSATQTPVTPSILRTCKQIRSEASRILYSKNTFLVSEPKRTLEWFTRIGRMNIKHLNSIRIFPHAVYYTKPMPPLRTTTEGPLWYKLLDQLAREATGLRHVYVYWDAQETCNHYGAGKDLRFVRELAKIRRLQSMVINRFYAVHWPRFLAEKMGVTVQERDSTWQPLRKYQKGTENLIP